jgi:putative flippase GtrA
MIQKRYIFKLERKAGIVFLLSAAVSVIGIGLSTLFIYLLNNFEFFYGHQFITKAIVVIIIFNYNFYFKRFAFEKRFLPELNKKETDNVE